MGVYISLISLVIGLGIIMILSQIHPYMSLFFGVSWMIVKLYQLKKWEENKIKGEKKE